MNIFCSSDYTLHSLPFLFSVTLLNSIYKYLIVKLLWGNLINYQLSASTSWQSVQKMNSPPYILKKILKNLCIFLFHSWKGWRFLFAYDKLLGGLSDINVLIKPVGMSMSQRITEILHFWDEDMQKQLQVEKKNSGSSRDDLMISICYGNAVLCKDLLLVDWNTLFASFLVYLRLCIL